MENKTKLFDLRINWKDIYQNSASAGIFSDPEIALDPKRLEAIKFNHLPDHPIESFYIEEIILDKEIKLAKIIDGDLWHWEDLKIDPFELKAKIENM